MKLRLKLALLATMTGALFAFGSCAAFWGDLLGDVTFLRGID
jgi:hypothetical protein